MDCGSGLLLTRHIRAIEVGAVLWWHPVSVTDPAMRVADDPLPLAEGLAVIRDTVATQDAAHREGRRHVFRCA